MLYYYDIQHNSTTNAHAPAPVPAPAFTRPSPVNTSTGSVAAFPGNSIFTQNMYSRQKFRVMPYWQRGPFSTLSPAGWWGPFLRLRLSGWMGTFLGIRRDFCRRPTIKHCDKDRWSRLYGSLPVDDILETPFDVSTGTSGHDVFRAAVNGVIEAFFGAGVSHWKKKKTAEHPPMTSSKCLSSHKCRNFYIAK